MRVRLAARKLILIVVAVAVTAALSWAVAVGGAPPTDANPQVPDTTTVGRLSRNADRTTPASIQTVTNISDTAWLAAGLLLTPINVQVNLPLIER
jgi:hypothetical protein